MTLVKPFPITGCEPKLTCVVCESLPTCISVQTSAPVHKPGFPSTQSALWSPAPTALRWPRCPPAPHPLTGVGLQQHLSLPQDPLCPVLGAVCPSQEVFKVSIKLGLLCLAEFLLCELGRKRQGRPRGQALEGGLLYHTPPWSLVASF